MRHEVDVSRRFSPRAPKIGYHRLNGQGGDGPAPEDQARSSAPQKSGARGPSVGTKACRGGPPGVRVCRGGAVRRIGSTRSAATLKNSSPWYFVPTVPHVARHRGRGGPGKRWVDEDGVASATSHEGDAEVRLLE